MRRVWPKGSGIYAIHISGAPRYVGRTRNFANRFGIHNSQLKAGEHKNQSLQNLFDKDHNATFEVLENLEGVSYPTNLHIEQAWISWLHDKHGLTNQKGLEALGLELTVKEK